MSNGVQFDNRFTAVGADTGYLSTIAKAQNVAATPNKMNDLATGVLQTGQNLNKVLITQNNIDSATAAAGAKDLLLSDEYIQADMYGKKDLIEAYTMKTADKSKASYSASLGVLGGQYAKVKQGVIQEQKDTIYNNIGLAGHGIKNDDTFGKNPEERVSKWINEMYFTYAELGLDRGTMKNLFLSGQLDSIGELMSADPEIGMEELKQLKKDFSSKTYLGSEAAVAQSQVKSKIKALESMYTSSIKEKAKQDKLKAAATLADYERSLESDEPGIPSPIIHSQEVASYKSDELQMKTYMDKLNNKYTEYQERVDFNSKYSTLETHPKVPSHMKDKWQKTVNTDATQYFDYGMTNEFIQVAINNPSYMKETGQLIYNKMWSENDPDKLKALDDRLQNIMLTPKGATALRNTLSDEQFSDLAIMDYYSKIMTGGDIAKARNLIDTAKQNIVKQAWDESTKKDVYSHAAELGPLANQYLSVMTYMNNINPEVARAQEKRIYKFYENQISSFNSIVAGSSKVNIDTSAGTNIVEDQALKPEITNESIVSAFKKQTYGAVPDTIKYLPNGKVNVSNSLTGDSIIIDANSIVQKDNANILTEIGQTKQGKPVGEIITSSGVDIVSGLGKSFSTMGSKLIDSMAENAMDTYHKVASFFISEDPTKDVNNPNVFTDEQKDIIKSIVVRQNKEISKSIPTIDPKHTFKKLLTYENPKLLNLPDSAKLEPYVDSNGSVYAVNTGFGKMLKTGFKSKEEAEKYIIDNSIQPVTKGNALKEAEVRYQKDLERVQSDFEGAPKHIQNVLGMMYYQLGSLDKFPKATAAIKKAIKEPTSSNWAKAQKELLDSTWAKKQTPKRAKEEVSLLYPENDIEEIYKQVL